MAEISQRERAATGEVIDLYRSLAENFKGELLRPADAGYENARSVWNGMFDRYPCVIARCDNVSDVQHAVRSASQAGTVTAIRCGGHSLAGFSTCDGLVIDLSRMRQVTVDAESRGARFAGGCLLGSVDASTQKAGLVFPSGVVSHTGAGGLVLGGGTGWLTRRYGLSCDNVEGFTMITADGSLIRASAKENEDLFWALRGGGGNFGLVTEFEVRLHPLTSVVLAEGWSAELDMRRQLELWRGMMPEAPHDLKWNINLRLAPSTAKVQAELRGRPTASSSMIWTGSPEAGQRYLNHATSLCHPQTATIRPISYLDLQTMADADFPHGRRYYTKSGYFAGLDDSTIDRLIAATSEIPAQESIIELAYLGGAAAEVSAPETAFGDRSAPYVLTVLANWCDPADDVANSSWVRALFQELRPAMKPGVYVNFMSGDEQDRVPEAYRERWERMVAVKSHYDPTNFFRLNQNVPPRKVVTAFC